VKRKSEGESLFNRQIFTKNRQKNRPSPSLILYRHVRPENRQIGEKSPHLAALVECRLYSLFAQT